MQLDKMTMARARLAIREAARGFLFDPNVNLIDFGFPEHEGQIVEDELSIRFHVHRKLSGIALESAVDTGYTTPIPPTIEGFPTDVPEGTYRPNQFFRRRAMDPRAERADPMRCGISISDARHITYGTLGALVRDRTTGVVMILSNWHVLVGDWAARPGQFIYQPGRLDGGTFADTVAAYTRDAMGVNLDAAVALLRGDRPLVNHQVGLGPIRGVKSPELGMNLAKSGRRTGVTFGRVTAVEGVAKMNYGWIERVIRHIVTIEPHSRFEQVSDKGDSGSAWVDEDTNEAVGLHFAGSNRPERALALDMLSVLEALDVDIETREEPADIPEARRQRELVMA